MDWVELVIETTTEGSDLIADILNSNGSTGVAIEDPGEARALIRKKCNWDYIKPGVLNTEGDTAIVRGYMPITRDLKYHINEVKNSLDKLPRNYLNLGPLNFYIKNIKEKNWTENWKKHYKPIKIGQHIIIKPSWEKYKPRAKDVVIQIDPGMAFGTGTHESTALCIEFLERYVRQGDRVFDIGCGSGILALVAAKLGASSVEAYDLQQMAVYITKRNAKLNNADTIIRVNQGSLLDKVRGRADVIVANIVADAIIKMSPTIAMHLNPGAIFIASGIITDRKQEVYEGLSDGGLVITEELVRNQWLALVAKVKESFS